MSGPGNEQLHADVGTEVNANANIIGIQSTADGYTLQTEQNNTPSVSATHQNIAQPSSATITSMFNKLYGRVAMSHTEKGLKNKKKNKKFGKKFEKAVSKGLEKKPALAISAMKALNKANPELVKETLGKDYQLAFLPMLDQHKKNKESMRPTPKGPKKYAQLKNAHKKHTNTKNVNVKTHKLVENLDNTMTPEPTATIKNTKDNEFKLLVDRKGRHVSNAYQALKDFDEDYPMHTTTMSAKMMAHRPSLFDKMKKEAPAPV